MTAQTLYDKLWESHVVTNYDEGVSLLYIDRQMLHEVSSPQAFAGVRQRPSQVRRTGSHLAVADHAVPTHDQDQPIEDPQARAQVAMLVQNTKDFHINYVPLTDLRHGIVHVIGPEQGFTQPGITLVCGDSHTSTHGAFGALAFGIGASECECVLATQTLRQKRAINMNVRVNGKLPPGVYAKDIILSVIGQIGAAGAVGYAIEYSGDTIRGLSMEARMTLCNMTIEAGSRTGLIAPDETTFAYLKGRPMAPKGEHWEKALDYWKTLPTDAGAKFDRIIDIDATTLIPHITWGTSPDQVLPITGRVPDPASFESASLRSKVANALAYMGLKPGTALEDIVIDHVFIGSCTNSRIEDLRAAAAVVKGRKTSSSVRAMVVPGSGQVKQQAEAEGLDRIFLDAGFEWRSPGCSLCVAMNDDRLLPGERCASTSNRNFEGRQGIGARTHLMSPAMAAAAAITGHMTDVRALLNS